MQIPSMITNKQVLGSKWVLCAPFLCKVSWLWPLHKFIPYIQCKLFNDYLVLFLPLLSFFMRRAQSLMITYLHMVVRCICTNIVPIRICWGISELLWQNSCSTLRGDSSNLASGIGETNRKRFWICWSNSTCFGLNSTSFFLFLSIVTFSSIHFLSLVIRIVILYD